MIVVGGTFLEVSGTQFSLAGFSPGYVCGGVAGMGRLPGCPPALPGGMCWHVQIAARFEWSCCVCVFGTEIGESPTLLGGVKPGILATSSTSKTSQTQSPSPAFKLSVSFGRRAWSPACWASKAKSSGTPLCRRTPFVAWQLHGLRVRRCRQSLTRTLVLTGGSKWACSKGHGASWDAEPVSNKT